MITLKAWAKINIGLKILNKRDDGFHNIETTLSTINLADMMTIEKIDSGVVLETKGLDIPKEENLCYRAIDIFRKRFSVSNGVKVSLIKNIPVGGGLGGGSSDAACTLKGMNTICDLNVPDEELIELGKELGSDVPFFIKGGAAYARGRGDELKFFKLPAMSLVLYYPGYPISTQWAYDEYDKGILTPQPETGTISEEPKKKKKKRLSFEIKNDFEKVVFKKHPDLLDVKTNLIASGAYFVSLSGSGSCLFTIIDESIRIKVTKYLDGIGAQYYEVRTL